MSKAENRRRLGKTVKLITFSVVLQAGGCMFDTQAFVSGSLSAIYENIATNFIINSLADLLNVTPAF